VLESHTKFASGVQVPDTVAIAGLDGYARAKTTFTPLVPPYVGCLGPLFPPQAHVAASRVFFIDGKGVVRRLGLDRTVQQVATFPIGGQQEASFAVSPDGRHLLGTVLTIPPKSLNANGCAGTDSGFAPGDWSEDVYAADAGGPARLVSHRSWPQAQGGLPILSLVGWDSRGPVGTYPTSIGTQGGGPIRDGWYGNAARIDPTSGQVQHQLGSDTCFVTDVAPDGTYVCLGTNGIDVYNPDGSTAWNYSKPNADYYIPLLSPDRTRVAATGTAVLGKDGSVITVGGSGSPGIFVTGWLNNQTLIGWLGQTPFEMGVVNLAPPQKVIDLGFHGTFIGVVQG